jgi:hypothetical protein
MEEELKTNKREIVALQRFKAMMNEMMGKVETVRRASIAIRHKIPVSKLSVSIQSEGAAREWSTVVSIFVTPPSFKLVSLLSPCPPLSKIPKQVFF